MKRLEDEVLRGNMLLYMYVKYGSLQAAEEVFLYLLPLATLTLIPMEDIFSGKKQL